MPLKPVAWVFSGGSIRCAAHVGVVKALYECNLRPDVVVGTSGGSLVAALLASGMGPGELEELFLSYTNRRRALVDVAWVDLVLGLLLRDRRRWAGIVAGKALERLVKEHLCSHDTFIGLERKNRKNKNVIPLLIPAVNLEDGTETVFCDTESLWASPRNGKLAGFRICDHATISQAVRASISIPGVFVPAKIQRDPRCTCEQSRHQVRENTSDFDHFVDGGVRAGYPIAVAPKLVRSYQVLGVNLGYAGMRRYSVIQDGPLEILSQSLDIAMMDQVQGDLNDRRMRRVQVLTIHPMIYDIGTFETGYIPQMIQRGYEVTRQLLSSSGLSPSRSGEENQRQLFDAVHMVREYPAKGTPHFEQLRSQRIKV